MENKRYEELIDLIINENEEKARELFHEIVVEKSREIYENIMAEEEPMHEGDQVESMMDEIEADETAMHEDESDAEELDHDAEEAGDDLTKDMEADADAAGDEDDIEDKVDDLEDRLVDAENDIDALIKKFEEELGGAGSEEPAEEMMEEEVEEAEEMDEEVMEAVQLQKVSVTHGDNGSNTKSPALTKPKVEAAGVKPVKFSGDSEAVPTGPKGPSNEYSKKEGKLIGDVGNTPGMKKAPDLKAAPKPDTKDGSDKGAKSPVAKA
jgi:hypothetical protein